jgi:hypothetical protein
MQCPIPPEITSIHTYGLICSHLAPKQHHRPHQINSPSVLLARHHSQRSDSTASHSQKPCVAGCKCQGHWPFRPPHAHRMLQYSPRSPPASYRVDFEQCQTAGVGIPCRAAAARACTGWWPLPLPRPPRCRSRCRTRPSPQSRHSHRMDMVLVGVDGHLLPLFGTSSNWARVGPSDVGGW